MHLHLLYKVKNIEAFSAFDILVFVQRVGKIPYAGRKLNKNIKVNKLDGGMKKQRSETSLCREYSWDRKQKVNNWNIIDQRPLCKNFVPCSISSHKYPKRKLKKEEIKQSMEMVKEKAGALLTKEEFLTFKNYLSEYNNGRIGIKHLVKTLRKMFDSEKKEGMFTEIREIVHEDDLAEFDKIVYEKGKMFERVKRRNDNSTKVNICEKKYASKTPLEKFKNLHYSVSSDDIRSSLRRGGSQPVLNINSKALNAKFRPNTAPINSVNRRPSGQYLKSDSRKHIARSFHNSLSNIDTKGFSKSCDFLLNFQSHSDGFVPDSFDNKDIEEEEKFLNEEMKTEWIPKPRRSISLAMFHAPRVCNFGLRLFASICNQLNSNDQEFIYYNLTRILTCFCTNAHNTTL